MLRLPQPKTSISATLTCSDDFKLSDDYCYFCCNYFRSENLLCGFNFSRHKDWACKRSRTFSCLFFFIVNSIFVSVLLISVINNSLESVKAAKMSEKLCMRVVFSSFSNY